MNKFCSRECYAEYRRKYCIKERASVYTQTEQECTYCHKKIMLPKNRLTKTRSFLKNSFNVDTPTSPVQKKRLSKCRSTYFITIRTFLVTLL